MTAGIAGPLGFNLEKVQGRVINRTAAATVVGGVYQLDLALSDGSVTTTAPGLSTSGLSNIIAVGGVDSKRITCIAEEAVADDQELLVTFVGRTTARTVNGSGDEGSFLVLVNAQNHLDATSAAGEALVGFLEDDPGADTAGTAGTVYFDGIRGFGTMHA